MGIRSYLEIQVKEEAPRIGVRLRCVPAFVRDRFRKNLLQLFDQREPPRMQPSMLLRPGATPKEQYDQLRAQTLDDIKVAKATLQAR